MEKKGEQMEKKNITDVRKAEHMEEGEQLTSR